MIQLNLEIFPENATIGLSSDAQPVLYRYQMNTTSKLEKGETIEIIEDWFVPIERVYRFLNGTMAANLKPFQYSPSNQFWRESNERMGLRIVWDLLADGDLESRLIKEGWEKVPQS